MTIIFGFIWKKCQEIIFRLTENYMEIFAYNVLNLFVQESVQAFQILLIFWLIM